MACGSSTPGYRQFQPSRYIMLFPPGVTPRKAKTKSQFRFPNPWTRTAAWPSSRLTAEGSRRFQSLRLRRPRRGVSHDLSKSDLSTAQPAPVSEGFCSATQLSAGQAGWAGGKHVGWIPPTRMTAWPSHAFGQTPLGVGQPPGPRRRRDPHGKLYDLMPRYATSLCDEQIHDTCFHPP